MIYADHAATTPIDARVVDAMEPWLREGYGNPSSMYRVGRDAAGALIDARERMALDLGCAPREVYMCSCGSEADNQALKTMIDWGSSREKRHIVASAIEHPAVLRYVEYLKRCGIADFDLVVPDTQGIVHPEDIKAAIRPDTCGVSVMYVNNEIGTIQPIAQIAQVAHDAGVLFHTDAVQAAGHIPLNVEALGVDLASLSAHKFYGPKGVGALICRRGIEPAQLIFGGGQERGSRAGTENVTSVVGMAHALHLACESQVDEGRRITQLKEALAHELLSIPGALRTIPEQVPCTPGTLHMCFTGVSREALVALLDQHGVCISAGSACSAGALETSHVLAALGVSPEAARGAIRFSLGRENTRADVDEIARAVRASVEQLKRTSL